MGLGEHLDSLVGPKHFGRAPRRLLMPYESGKGLYTICTCIRGIKLGLSNIIQGSGGENIDVDETAKEAVKLFVAALLPLLLNST